MRVRWIPLQHDVELAVSVEIPGRTIARAVRSTRHRQRDARVLLRPGRDSSRLRAFRCGVVLVSQHAPTNVDAAGDHNGNGAAIQVLHLIVAGCRRENQRVATCRRGDAACGGDAAATGASACACLAADSRVSARAGFAACRCVSACACLAADGRHARDCGFPACASLAACAGHATCASVATCASLAARASLAACAGHAARARGTPDLSGPAWRSSLTTVGVSASTRGTTWACCTGRDAGTTGG